MSETSRVARWSEHYEQRARARRDTLRHALEHVVRTQGGPAVVLSDRTWRRLIDACRAELDGRVGMAWELVAGDAATMVAPSRQFRTSATVFLAGVVATALAETEDAMRSVAGTSIVDSPETGLASHAAHLRSRSKEDVARLRAPVRRGPRPHVVSITDSKNVAVAIGGSARIVKRRSLDPRQIAAQLDALLDAVKKSSDVVQNDKDQLTTALERSSAALRKANVPASRVRRLLQGIAGTVQTVGAAPDAVQAVITALRAWGVPV